MAAVGELDLLANAEDHPLKEHVQRLAPAIRSLLGFIKERVKLCVASRYDSSQFEPVVREG